jgi:hypothetical protein
MASLRHLLVARSATKQKQCGNEIEFRLAPVEPDWISYSGSMGLAWVWRKFSFEYEVYYQD